MDNELSEVPISIQKGFPQTLTDEELKNIITELSSGVVTTKLWYSPIFVQKAG